MGIGKKPAPPTSRSRDRRSPTGLRKRAVPYGLLSPAALWLLLFFVLPTIFMLYTSLKSGGLLTGGSRFTWEVENYSEAIRLFRIQYVRSFEYAAIVTAATLLLSYPLAYWIAFYGGRRKSSLLLMILLPFFVSYVIRTIQWQFILGDEGIVLGTLKDRGLLSADFHVLATPLAVIAGMAYNFLPFALLPIYVALERIDRAVVEAAEDLYSSRLQTFLRVVLPLSLPGVLSAFVLTFVPAAGDFINAEILGGPGTAMIGNIIQTQFLENRNYPLASALSFVVMLGLLVVAVGYGRILGTKDPGSTPVFFLGSGDVTGGLTHSRRAKGLTRLLLPLYALLMYAYLLLPIVIMVVFGFNDGEGRATAKWQGFTLRWYEELLAVPGLTTAVKNTLLIAIISTVVSTILGTLLGLALGRYRFRGHGLTSFTVFLAIATPEIVLGTSLLTLFVAVSEVIPLGFPSILIAHIMFSVSFVALVVRARTEGVEHSLEEASQDLWATPFYTFFKITIPMILPGIVSGGLLAFALSVDDFVITSFVSGQTETFPIWVFGSSRIGIPSQVNAIGTLIFVFGASLAIGNLLVQRRRAR